MPPEFEGPIPATGASPVFHGEDATGRPLVDLDAAGYVEEEWFVTGRADARGADGSHHATDVPYTTRLLLRRPADAASFSGTVHLEPFHVLGEGAPTWGVAHTQIMRRGDAWIGVTVNSGVFGQYDRLVVPGGVSTLQDANPTRYGRLHLYVADADAVAELHDVPMTDTARIMERINLAIAQGTSILEQVAHAVKTGAAGNPLADVPVERLYASGWSQTGMFWRAFVEHGLHARCRTDDGGPVVDAFFIGVAPAPAEHPDDAVLVNLLSEGEVIGAGFGSAAGVPGNTDTPRFRGYEIPGTFHSWSKQVAQPDDGHAVHNDHPWHVLVHALYDAMDRWVRDATPMPEEPRVERDRGAEDGIARDEHGNARGGVRTPWTDVPAARYFPSCSCHPLTGIMEPLPADVLRARYVTRARYEQEFADASAALERRRWLLPDDAPLVRPLPVAID